MYEYGIETSMLFSIDNVCIAVIWACYELSDGRDNHTKMGVRYATLTNDETK